MIMAKVTCLLFERNSATQAQKDAEPHLVEDTQQKPGIKMNKAISWDKNSRYFS
jgi:hypothetical protein